MLLLGLGFAEVVEVDAELRLGGRAHRVEQPVAQRERRRAVLLVVGADGFEQLVVGGLQPRLVGDDRSAALADALLETDEAVVALELLQRVAVLADLQALADDGVEVDEHPVAQEVVDLGLARGVLDRQRPQLGQLVRRVVEDVHAGVLGAQRDDAIDELLERGLLGVEVVRPRALVARACAPPAPQVLDALVADVGVALEVEEDVARDWARGSSA